MLCFSLLLVVVAAVEAVVAIGGRNHRWCCRSR